MKLIVTSDWHLDWITAGVPRHNELEDDVHRILTRAREWKPDAFIFLGDLCDPDSTRSHRSVAFAAKVKRHLTEHDILSLWIAGNHDVIEDGHGTTTLSALRYDGNDGAIVFEEPALQMFDSFNFIALPYTARSHSYVPNERIESWAIENESTLARKPLVIAGHLNIEGIGPGSETKDMPRGRDVFFPLEACAKHFPNALLLNGHYHRQQKFKAKRGGPEIHIPGSLERLTFTEEGNEPGWLEVEW